MRARARPAATPTLNRGERKIPSPSVSPTFQQCWYKWRLSAILALLEAPWRSNIFLWRKAPLPNFWRFQAILAHYYIFMYYANLEVQYVTKYLCQIWHFVPNLAFLQNILWYKNAIKLKFGIWRQTWRSGAIFWRSAAEKISQHCIPLFLSSLIESRTRALRLLLSVAKHDFSNYKKGAFLKMYT